MAPFPYATFSFELARLLLSYQSIATLSYSYLPYDLRQHNLSMFWAVSLPSEWPFHCLVLHALMLVYGFYGNGHQSMVALGPCVWGASPSGAAGGGVGRINAPPSPVWENPPPRYKGAPGEGVRGVVVEADICSAASVAGGAKAPPGAMEMPPARLPEGPVNTDPVVITTEPLLPLSNAG